MNPQKLTSKPSNKPLDKTVPSKPQNTIARPQNTIVRPDNSDKTIVNNPSLQTNKIVLKPQVDKTVTSQANKDFKQNINNQPPLQTNNTVLKPQVDKTVTSQANKELKKQSINNQPPNIDKTMPNNSKIQENNTLKNNINSNPQATIDKTQQYKGLGKSIPHEEETKAMVLIDDDATAKYKGVGNLNKSSSADKTQVVEMFKSPQINVFKPLDPTFHTLAPPPLLSRNSSENSKFGVKIALQTTKIDESSAKTFNISEILDFSENEDWEIEDVLLGKGSYGNVYKVHDKKTKVAYALKSIELNSNDDDFDFIYEKTLYEVFLMKQTNKLNSPNILKLVDCFKKFNEGTSEEFLSSCSIMIVMELCECSLNDIIEYRSDNALKWSEQELLYYFYVLLETLLQISKLNIHHRDIKPRNILYNLASKAVKFADFGEGKLLSKDLSESLYNSLSLSQDILKSQSNQNLMNTVRGTPVYMSPEIYQSYKLRKYNCNYHPLSSDIFSLGLTFLVMKRLDTNINRNDIEIMLNDSTFQTDTLTNRLIKAMLLADPKLRLDKVNEIYEKELKPLKNQLKVPDEQQILKLLKMKSDESLNPNELKQKKMLIAQMYRKMGNFAAAKEILNFLLNTIGIEMSNSPSPSLEIIFFKYRNLVSLASIEIDEAKTENAIKSPLTKLDEAHDLLMTKAKNMINSSTFNDEYGNLLNEYGRAYRKFNQGAKALEFYERALKMAKDLKSSINTGVISYNIGRLFIQMKKYPEALEYLTLSLKVLENLKKQPNNNENVSQQGLVKELAKSQKLLADVFYNQRAFEKAEEYGKKSLAMMQEIYGNHHVNLLEHFNFLGLLYMSTGKKEASLTNLNKAYEICRDFIGDDSAKAAPILINIGILYIMTEKNQEAEKMLKKSEEICIANKMQTDLAHTYYSLGNLYGKLKNVEKAREIYKKALDIYEIMKNEHEKLAYIHFNLGGLAANLNEIDDAKLHFKASLENYQKFLGKMEYANNPNVKKMTDILKRMK